MNECVVQKKLRTIRKLRAVITDNAGANVESMIKETIPLSGKHPMSATSSQQSPAT